MSSERIVPIKRNARIPKNKKTFIVKLYNEGFYSGAEDGIRTRDPRLGKAMLYP
jgi:hypothetical protein